MKAKLFERKTQAMLAFLSHRVSDNSTAWPRLAWRNFYEPMSEIAEDYPKALSLAFEKLKSIKTYEKFFALMLLNDICQNLCQQDKTRSLDRITHVLGEFTQKEKNTLLLEAACDAFGSVWRPAAIPYIYELSFHPADNVRLSATQAYCSALDVDGENLKPKHLKRILELANDPIGEIRNYATFCVGRQLPFLKMDKPEIIKVLVRRTYDRHPFTKMEGYLSLAERGIMTELPRFKAYFQKRVQRHWHGDLTMACEAAGFYGDPELRQPLLAAQRVMQAESNYENQHSLMEWALLRCSPNPIIRAKTSKCIGLEPANFDWVLDANGAIVTYSAQDPTPVINLREHGELLNVLADNHEVLLVFKKTAQTPSWSYFDVGDTVAIGIEGVTRFNAPSLTYPATFGGVKNRTTTSATLVVNDHDYLIQGNDLTIHFYPGQ